MPRKMRMIGCKSTVNVKEFFMTRNFWEYFVYKLPAKSTGIGDAVVKGFETEAGSFSIDEVGPYIMPSTRTTDLSEVMPAPGYEWVD